MLSNRVHIPPSLHQSVHPIIHVFLCLSVSLLDIAAATLFARDEEPELSESQLRVAFDGDGVIFSDEAETVFKEKGIEAFTEHEVEKQNIPLPEVRGTSNQI